MSRKEDEYLIERMGKLLAEIAVIVNGLPPSNISWSYHDLPEKVRALKQAPPAAVPLREDLLGAIGRAWTHPTTKHMPVDVTLAVAIEKEVRDLLAAAREGE